MPASWPQLGGQAGGALRLGHAPGARSQFRCPRQSVLFRRPRRCENHKCRQVTQGPGFGTGAIVRFPGTRLVQMVP
ncbi:MARVEL (membrane-associating) domain containing 2 [Mus musculus]|nr:MARVEL (membrane-associating) domain containing 2 [Mus musculus]